MTQNLISLQFTATQLTAIDQALFELEKNLTGLIALTPDQRSRLVKMGDKSEAFCHRTLDILQDNPDVLPRSFDLVEAMRDMQSHNALRARRVRMERIFEKINDTEMALGSDVMAAALEGYAFLKITGKAQGLESLKRELSARFTSRTSKGEKEAAPKV
ncbi:hypothetical protein [Andreprevotia chitinilytica]|uniref:hypothetical protein n=1 Tax=Andreprevotia chitinilytica TaxID=396808 RepID=UPI00055293A9|nr:hypothetical protein [Andreprevotia chitinilytica]